MPTDLNGQRVLVVGAAGGIGEATARAFAAQGASVVAAGRSLEKTEAVARSFGGEAAEVDILDEGSVDAMFAGRAPFHHVVMAAAATRSGPVGSLALADAVSSMDSKFWGAYRVARSARIEGAGSITFVSGFLSTRPSASAVLQGSINAALEALARGLALERAPVRVNAVSPGVVNTPLWGEMAEDDRRAFFASTAGRLPARRVGSPEDIAQAILFVATNPFATGSTVTVDGGGTIA
jgi:NAD(P)-dependent dehydrogenase (short-subunit alcohol dehydrogenase family)